MGRRLRLCVAAAAALATPAAAITPEEAQTLPVAELARRVLGEAAANVIDVDRPKWPTCDIGCPPLTEDQRSQAPPLHLGILFYQRPRAALNALYEWTGLCATGLIFVGYDSNGRVSDLGTGERWGVPRGMRRIAHSTKPGELAERRASESARCEGSDLRDYFAADNDVSALRIAVAAHLFAEAARRPGPLPFELSCRLEYGDCAGRTAIDAVARAFRPTRISQVRQVNCANPNRLLSQAGPDGCYSVDLDSAGESLVVEIADAYSELKLRRVEYSRSDVVY